MPVHINGQCWWDPKLEIFIINIKNSCVELTTLSHELLHAYFIVSGYPKVHNYETDESLLSHICREIENTHVDKLIYEEQKRRNIDLSYSYEQYYKNMKLYKESSEETKINLLTKFVSNLHL